MKRGHSGTVIVTFLSGGLSLGFGTIPKIPLEDFLGWFVEMSSYPPVELIYVRFYLLSHSGIIEVTITTLYMPTHSAGSHIHQSFVTGNSFINDRIHFGRSLALWCMGEHAEARQRDAHTGRLTFDWMGNLLFCRQSWFTLSHSCHNHIQGRLPSSETINLILKCHACYTFTLKEDWMADPQYVTKNIYSRVLTATDYPTINIIVICNCYHRLGFWY